MACATTLIGMLVVGAASVTTATAAESPTIALNAVPQPNANGFETDPGMAPYADGQGELFSISGLQGSYGELFEASPSGTITQVGPSYDAQYLNSAVNADGFDWLLTTEGLMAISASGAVTNLGIPLPTAADVALGPDGNLYISTADDAVMRCTITATPAAACSTTFPVPSSFTSEVPQSITSAGGQLWFTTSLGELGSLTTGGTVGGPYDEAPSAYSDGPAGPSPNMLSAASGNTLWTTSIASDDSTNSQLTQVSAVTGAILGRYGTKAGLPADANVDGLTVGPDGNVWFVDSGGAGAIGVLDVGDGRVTEFPFPHGYETSFVTPSGISVGPDNTIWFSAVTSGDNPAIGEITNLGSANASVRRTASATGYRVASLHIGCSGSAGAGCSGSVKLTATATSQEKLGPQGQTERVTVHKTVTLGTARYDLVAGKSTTTKVTLDAEATKLLKAASTHTVSAVATATPQIGSPTHFALTLTA